MSMAQPYHNGGDAKHEAFASRAQSPILLYPNQAREQKCRLPMKTNRLT
jgi:hypothetical protein